MSVTQPAPAAYRYLWHLEAIGVLTVDTSPGVYAYRTPVWDALYEGASPEPALVAMIDTGVDLAHPYLAGAVAVDDAIDVATAPDGLGLVGVEAASDRKWVLPPALFASFAGGLTQDERDLFDARIVHLHDRVIPGPARDAFHRHFAAHGTACAGLVVGASPMLPETGAIADDAIPYFGVDPYSRILSITTSFVPDPMQIITALLYAVSKGADVILMPRSIEQITAPAQPPVSAEEHEQVEAALQLALLEKLMRWVSLKIPVIVASGNSAESSLMYPASLAAPDNGIIAVGAVTYNGQRSAYSNYGANLTLVAPSADDETYTRQQVRLDTTAPAYVDHPYPDNTIPFSPQEILTIDIAGRYGYAGSSAEDEEGLGKGPSLSRGYFTMFGGTSAAASIVAGVAALVVRKLRTAGRTPDGVAVKTLLASNSILNDLPGMGATALLPDDPNGTKPDLAALFGSGMVHAGKAVSAVDKLR